MLGLSEAMGRRVHAALDDCEQSEDVVVCLAVESGSRAWGFASQDSDFDVRFIYVQRPERYLSIDLEERRDVIERPLENGLDLSGWDLRKALRLFRKSNPPLMEWLQCSLVYRERFSVAARLRKLLPQSYSHKAAYFHYLHMAQGNFREYLRGETVWLKKYLYVLRPLMAVRWIERGNGPVPIEFQRLVDGTVDDNGVRAAIDRLLADKAAGEELDRGPRIEAISGFIESELDRLGSADASAEGPAPGVDALNQLFREAINEVWSPQQSAPAPPSACRRR
jgi:predicted nucleotidyltransferase